MKVNFFQRMQWQYKYSANSFLHPKVLVTVLLADYALTIKSTKAFWRMACLCETRRSNNSCSPNILGTRVQLIRAFIPSILHSICLPLSSFPSTFFLFSLTFSSIRPFLVSKFSPLFLSSLLSLFCLSLFFFPNKITSSSTCTFLSLISLLFQSIDYYLQRTNSL